MSFSVKSKQYMRTIRRFSAVLIGIVFFVSGMLKLMDPVGTSLIVEEYLKFFRLGFLHFAGYALGACLALAETILGAALVTGVWKKAVGITVLAFLGFFTIVTLILLIFNPVMDCGCFGDALVLTNWETFWKNVALLVASVVVFIWKKEILAFLSWRTRWMASFYTFVFMLFLSFYCLYALPIFDFRPYKIGTDINEAMSIPEGAEQPVYATTFILEKDGVRREFTLDDYPSDTLWKFVDSKTELVKEGYEPLIRDFFIEDIKTGDDLTQDILSDTSYVFLLIAYDLHNADDGNIDLINGVYDYCVENGYRFYCLTASSDDEILRWQDNTGAEYDFCRADDIALKTIIRSNPGLMLLKRGVIYNKWSHNTIPSESELCGRLEDIPVGQMADNGRWQTWVDLCVWYVLPLCLVVVIEVAMFSYRRKRNNHKQQWLR